MGSREQVVRIGFIGAGAIARQRHLPALQAIEGVEMRVVCNQRRESATAIAAAYGIPDVASSWHEVVSRPDIDVIWIGTTPHLHAPITIAALEAGKHVFCQARMAMNLAEARAMLACATSHPHQVTMLCPPPMAMKYGLYFEKLLRDRSIGRIYHFYLRALSPQWADASAPAHWRQKIEFSGENILSVGIYAEVLHRFLGNPVSLCAEGRVFITPRQGYTVRVPDYLHVLGQWPEDISATLEWSGLAWHGGSERLEIYGIEGNLVYDFTKDEIFLGLRSDPQPVAVIVPPEFTKEWTVERDFIRAVRENGSPEPSFRTGVRYMEFVDAVGRSMAQGTWVNVSCDSQLPPALLCRH